MLVTGLTLSGAGKRETTSESPAYLTSTKKKKKKKRKKHLSENILTSFIRTSESISQVFRPK